jgi:hypothetical protein
MIFAMHLFWANAMHCPVKESILLLKSPGVFAEYILAVSLTIGPALAFIHPFPVINLGRHVQRECEFYLGTNLFCLATGEYHQSCE